MLKRNRDNIQSHGKVNIFSYMYMILCVLIALYPIIWIIMSSFKTNKEFFSNSFGLPTSFSFIGYQQALQISPIMKFFFNSAVIAILTTLLNVFILAMAAYVIARVEFPGRRLIFSIISVSMVIPITSLLQPLYIIINKLGLYDTKTALILVYAALSLPMSLMILRRSFESIPRELEEAAYIDGAGFFRTFVQIMIPCAKNGLASAAVLTFLNSWNEFTFALVLTSSASVRTLPLSLSYFKSQFSFNYTAMFAAITMAVIPSIIVFVVFQEHIITSLTAGSVK